MLKSIKEMVYNWCGTKLALKFISVWKVHSLVINSEENSLTESRDTFRSRILVVGLVLSGIPGHRKWFQKVSQGDKLGFLFRPVKNDGC